MVIRSALLLWFVTSASLYAQTPRAIDSLKNLLGRTPKGLNKIELYEKICWNYIEVKPDFTLATAYADSARLLSVELKSEKGLYQAEYNYGQIAAFKGEYDKALEHLTAFRDYERSKGDSLQLAKAIYHIALIDVYKGNFEKSLGSFYRILSIEEKAGNEKRVAVILNVIGGIYKNTNKFREAIDTYRKSGEIFRRSDLRLDYGMSLQNRGNAYLSLAQYDSAKYVYEQSLQLFTEFKHDVFIATVLGNLGNMYELQNEYSRALQYHEKALLIWRKQARKKSLANSLNNLGKCNLKLLEYKQAGRYLDEALTLAKELAAKPLLVEIYANIRDLQVARGEFEKAYTTFRMYNEIKDSIFNDKNSKLIEDLKAKYETEKKNKQIELLAKEKELQVKETARQSMLGRTYLIAAVLAALVAILVFYIFRQRYQLAQKSNLIKDAEFKTRLTELEMKALRAQINPHFLFNCLNAVNLMIRKGENDKACLYLAKFSKLVRLILENAESSSVTLESELTLIESYMQLEEIRLPEKITFTIKVDENIGADATYIPSMVLQPVIENAIWHGLVNRENDTAGMISIHVSQEDDVLLCTVEDNGVGREKAGELRDKSLMSNRSMGMRITGDRLQLISRKPGRDNIEFVDLKDSRNHPLGTRVILHVPIVEQND